MTIFCNVNRQASKIVNTFHYDRRKKDAKGWHIKSYIVISLTKPKEWPTCSLWPGSNSLPLSGSMVLTEEERSCKSREDVGDPAYTFEAQPVPGG